MLSTLLQNHTPEHGVDLGPRPKPRTANRVGSRKTSVVSRCSSRCAVFSVMPEGRGPRPQPQLWPRPRPRRQFNFSSEIIYCSKFHCKLKFNEKLYEAGVIKWTATATAYRVSDREENLCRGVPRCSRGTSRGTRTWWKWNVAPRPQPRTAPYQE